MNADSANNPASSAPVALANAYSVAAKPGGAASIDNTPPSPKPKRSPPIAKDSECGVTPPLEVKVAKTKPPAVTAPMVTMRCEGLTCKPINVAARAVNANVAGVIFGWSSSATIVKVYKPVTAAEKRTSPLPPAVNKNAFAPAPLAS